MIRRSPTRIELKLDDLQEFEAIRKEREGKKESDKQNGFNPSSIWPKIPQSEIQERIGYVPQTSQQSATHVRQNI